MGRKRKGGKKVNGTTQGCPLKNHELIVNVFNDKTKKHVSEPIQIKVGGPTPGQQPTKDGQAWFTDRTAGKYTIQIPSLPDSLKPLFATPLPEVSCTIKDELEVVTLRLKEALHSFGVRVEDEDGNIVKDVTIKLKLTNNSERTVNLAEATLEDDGTYLIPASLPAGVCEVSFPELFDVEWKAK